MRWICCFLLACGAAIADEPSALTLPESDTFVVGEAYVIRSTSEITVLLKESPNFSLEKMPSPVAVYARVAGETTQRLQILDSPHIFFVTASQPGQTELIILAGQQAVWKTLLATGQAPQPPPGPQPPILSDVLSRCHEADRRSQVQILRQLAAKNLTRDSAGLQAAKDFVNAERIRRRTEDWIPYTDAVAESIFSGRLSELADILEGKR